MERSDVDISRWIVKAAVWIATAAVLVSSGSLDDTALAYLLVCVAVDVADTRFFRTVLTAGCKALIVVFVARTQPTIGLLLASVSFDLAFTGPVALAALPVAATALVGPAGYAVVGGLAATASAASGWIARRHELSRLRHAGAIDAERAARYRLEEAQARLETTGVELRRATERAERTRIAHAIHDDVGHRLSGVLMQLQAVRRLIDNQPARASAMLDTAVGALTEAVESIRETVHDLRPRPESDVAAVRRLCAEFRLCPVAISLDDRAYSALPQTHREACVTSVRELLTNAARHSRAQSISIRIDAGKRLRLVYGDDGIGAARIREGLGLSGIRHRMEALGGTVAVSGHDGFTVRCVVPMEGEHGEDPRRGS